MTIDLDDELAEQYLAASREQLAEAESDLLTLEAGGAEIDEALVNRIFRAIHSIKGGAGFFDLSKIRDVAHRTEAALALIRSHQMAPTRARVTVLLRAVDMLQALVRDAAASNQADIAEIITALTGLRMDAPASPVNGQAGARCLRALLVEDDFVSRLLLQTFLSRYGECHIAVNGEEAVEAFRFGLERGQRYDLICMDILMPEMDGREAVRHIRALEEEHEILSTHGAKIIMTTTIDDVKEVIQCFQELCDAYLMKPIDLGELLSQMKSFQLVK